MKYSAAVDKLVAAGHNPKKISKNVQGNATTDKQADTVTGVDPSDYVDNNKVVTFTVYGPVEKPSAPTDTPTQVNPPAGQNATVGQPVTFAFGAGACPSGQEMTGHQLYIDGKGQGSVSGDGGPQPWTPTAAGPHSVTYTVYCGDSVESPKSPPLKATVQAPPTTP